MPCAPRGRATQTAGKVLLFTVLLTNCSLPPLLSRYQPLAPGQRVDSLAPLTVVRYPSAKLINVDYGSTGRTMGCLVPAVVIGCLGGVAAGGYIGYKLFPDNLLAGLMCLFGGELAVGLTVGFVGKRLVIKNEHVNVDSAGLPDIGQLVLAGFARRAGSEVPGWPAMSVESLPVGFYYARKPGYTLEFATAQDASVNSGYRYCATVVATLYDAHEDIMWQRMLQYRAGQNNLYVPRGGATDRYSWLREEIQAAADSAVSDLIAHLKK